MDGAFRDWEGRSTPVFKAVLKMVGLDNIYPKLCRLYPQTHSSISIIHKNLYSPKAYINFPILLLYTVPDFTDGKKKGKERSAALGKVT